MYQYPAQFNYSINPNYMYPNNMYQFYNPYMQYSSQINQGNPNQN